jgi:peroxiredoxin Q/BCP
MLSAGAVAQQPVAGQTELKAGDPAPDFTLPASDGQTYTLSKLRGKAVVLAWFPKAFTGG